ncbi:cytochrome o ubiquinol oxidase subunit III [Azomonas macrocytogenes]|uniref:Cytochrome bo(3) ubiquinol oxidase subunit 3 n=1 Tax=Azomonas macrocytogenes TaxID=69962 RepID=A0A839T0H5_AZOMA|nr:cytochrome o ubiquinol oxidase subunit III [Azomonas macrocytogenes]MBB3101924.1 cytochrome o ubiquinol oxidase subunit 3 [Azomonas macrocytogenes]
MSAIETPNKPIHTAHGEGHGHHHDAGEIKLFGMWVYLMTDCILFACLFASYVVLKDATAGGVTGKDIFELPFVLVETFVLLFSSITSGLATVAMHRGDKAEVMKWLKFTFLLGAVFVGMEVYEFHHLIAEGHGPSHSAFLSAFFTLVGTHGLHVTAGLLWMLVLMHQINTRGLNDTNKSRLNLLALFWHFLDVVWICVFTVVYLMGVL